MQDRKAVFFLTVWIDVMRREIRKKGIILFLFVEFGQEIANLLHLRVISRTFLGIISILRKRKKKKWETPHEKKPKHLKQPARLTISLAH